MRPNPSLSLVGLVLALAVTPLVAADPPERDPLKQPFASTSIWNTPIGSGARFVPANLPAVPGGNPNTWVGMPWADEEIVVMKPTAPATTINRSRGWDATDRTIAAGGVLATVPMPRDLVIPTGSGNTCSAFLLGDGRTVMQFQPLYRGAAGASALAMLKFPDVDLYGAGIGGAHGGSRLSAVGGSIRIGELRPGQQGPRHALKVNVFAKQVLYRCTTPSDGYRWPATTADGYAVGWYGTHGDNRNTAMKMGALLAIPPTTSIASIGLETEPARQLAWTLQNYGAYIVDDTYAPSFAFNVDEGADGSFREQFKRDYAFDFNQTVASNIAWSRDCQRLHQALHVVDNNGPTSIGGGGTPRQPLAPPLADPAFPVPGSVAVSGSAGAVRVAWSDPSTSETGFEIWRRPSGGSWISVATLAANVAAWTDAGATAGMTWQYRVRLIKAPSVSAWSAIVSITPTNVGGLPAGWSGGNLGSVGVPGTFSQAGGTWTVSGSGTDIWNAADGGTFVRQSVSGDVRITARVNSVGNTNAWAKAGVMVRESTAAGSRHAFTCVTPGNGVAFQRRLSTNATSSHTAGPKVAAPYWVRLERIGNTLIGSCSTNGSTWVEVRRDTVSMSATVLVGLAVTSHANGTACTATFSNVEIISAPSAAN